MSTTRTTTGSGATTSSRGRSWTGWVGLLARLVLGIVFLWAGLSKVTALETSAEAVRAYQILPYEVANTLGYLLPVLEIALGALLVLGLFTRVAATFGALLQLAFVIGIASVWARGISIDCGCFGGGGTISAADATAKYPWELARDIGLLLCGVWLMVRPATPASMDRWLFGATHR